MGTPAMRSCSVWLSLQPARRSASGYSSGGGPVVLTLAYPTRIQPSCSQKPPNTQRFGTSQSRTVLRRRMYPRGCPGQPAPGFVRNVGLRETSSGDQALDALDLGHPPVCRQAAPLHQVAQLSIPGERVGASRRSVSGQSCCSPILGEPAGKRRSIWALQTEEHFDHVIPAAGALAFL